MMHPSAGGRNPWLLIADEATDYAHSIFLKQQSDQVKILIQWIKNMGKNYKIYIRTIRLDNSGENRKLQQECDEENLGIRFEFTAPGAPQQNSMVERKVPTIIGRGRAMMIHAGSDENYRRKLWCEIVSTATKLDNLIMTEMGGKPPHFNFFNEHLSYIKHLRAFGEMTLVASHDRKKIRNKIEEEEELLCLLDMQMIILEMSTDSYISKLDKHFK